MSFFVKILTRTKDFILNLFNTVFIKIEDKWYANLKSKDCRFFLYDTETIHSFKKTPYKQEFTPIKDIIEISYVILKKNGKKIFKTEKSFIVEEFWQDKKYLKSKNWQQVEKNILDENGNILLDINGQPITEKVWEPVQNFAINKIPKWKQAIKDGTTSVKKWADILKEIAMDLEYYDINIITAYNIMFDRQAIVSTNEVITELYYPQRKSTYYYIGNFWNIPYVDTYFAIEKIVTSEDFIEWADNHEEEVKNKKTGNIRLTAEVLQQFFLRDRNKKSKIKELDSTNWSETHIAKEDIECESEIIEGIIIDYEGTTLLVEIDKYGNALRANKLIKEKRKEKEYKQVTLLQKE